MAPFAEGSLCLDVQFYRLLFYFERFNYFLSLSCFHSFWSSRLSPCVFNPRDSSCFGLVFECFVFHWLFFSYMLFDKHPVLIYFEWLAANKEPVISFVPEITYNRSTWLSTYGRSLVTFGKKNTSSCLEYIIVWVWLLRYLCHFPSNISTRLPDFYVIVFPGRTWSIT